MREDTWASRTERVGRMLVDDGWTSAGDLNWARWRLAVSLNKYWYKSSGASARAHVFATLTYGRAPAAANTASWATSNPASSRPIGALTASRCLPAARRAGYPAPPGPVSGPSSAGQGSAPPLRALDPLPPTQEWAPMVRTPPCGRVRSDLLRVVLLIQVKGPGPSRQTGQDRAARPTWPSSSWPSSSWPSSSSPSSSSPSSSSPSSSLLSSSLLSSWPWPSWRQPS